MTYAPAQPTAVVQTPRSAPLYGASLGQAVARFFAKYATFSGRASRSEYWWWALVNAVVITALFLLTLIGGLAGATIDPMTGRSEPGILFFVGYALLGLWWLATILPTFAIMWRRLHDTNRSGAFALLGFVPGVGGIIVLVLMLLDTDPAGARFDA